MEEVKKIMVISPLGFPGYRAGKRGYTFRETGVSGFSVLEVGVRIPDGDHLYMPDTSAYGFGEEPKSISEFYDKMSLVIRRLLHDLAAINPKMAGSNYPPVSLVFSVLVGDADFYEIRLTVSEGYFPSKMVIEEINGALIEKIGELDQLLRVK